jgi:pSer/pThr/pTyr-binding forkhead associated (FHA) protein
MAEYNMNKERYTIGRLPDNDVRVDNPAVSGHHSLIINILNDSFLEDLNSTNGTYVNGKLIKKHALQHGDVITVGHHQLRFVEDGSAEDSPDDEFARTMIIDNSRAAAEAVIQATQASSPANASSPSAPAPSADVGEVDTIRSQNERSPPTLKVEAAPKPLPTGKIQVLNGSFAGREVNLNKALTTLGQPGVQVIAITRRNDGFAVIRVESKKGEPPTVNGETLSPKARKLADNDVIELIGIKMGFFAG